MEIYVRNKDGFVLNSYQFNNSFPSGIDNETMYAGEDYTVFEIDDLPDNPERDYFFKNYYYRNGVLDVVYVPEEYEIKKEIKRLKTELSDTDYMIIKSYESTISGQPVEYDMEKIHADRQSVRDRINELENYLKL